MNELVREIEEDIRREQLDKLFGKVGMVVVCAAIGAVLATAIYVFWHDQQQARQQAQTAKFIQGIDRFNAGDYKAAVAAFNALADDPASSYYGIAMLRKGQAQDADGDKDAAAKTYAALAKRDAAFGQLAAMLASGDMAQPKRESTFYATQSETRDWQLLQQGKKDEAIAGFLALSESADAPLTMRQRMREVVQYLAPEKLAEKKGTTHE